MVSTGSTAGCFLLAILPTTCHYTFEVILDNTNMHLSVQFFFKPYFLPPYVYTTGTGCVWRVYCMENLSCQLRFSCGSSLDKRSSTREDVCRCHTPIESVSRRSLLLLLQGKDLPTPFAVFSLLQQTLQHFRNCSLSNL